MILGDRMMSEDEIKDWIKDLEHQFNLATDTDTKEEIMREIETLEAVLQV